MIVDSVLPFPRGSTYKDLGNVTLASTIGAGILGKCFETVDDSNRPLVLRAVMADAALTNVGGKTVSYAAGKIGSNVDALANSDGEVSSIIDDAYATTFDVDQYDIFYVVEEGYVDASCEATVNAAGISVMADASTDNCNNVTAGSYVIGVSTEAVSDGIAEIHVLGGLKPSDPAS